MSYTIVLPVIFECDKCKISCKADSEVEITEGTDFFTKSALAPTSVPTGWIEDSNYGFIKHYCPECIEFWKIKT